MRDRRPDRYVRPPSHHDHVGHMVYETDVARCDLSTGGCGQTWTRTETGWRPDT